MNIYVLDKNGFVIEILKADPETLLLNMQNRLFTTKEPDDYTTQRFNFETQNWESSN